MSPSPQPKSEKTRRSLFARRRIPFLNIVIGVLAILVALLSYALLKRHVLQPPVEQDRSGPGGGRIIQLEVLNGCGAQGAAVAFTDFLRARGYDVVEVRNYKTFDVKESLVIDRTGELGNAEKVAYALGVRKENIIQQLNPEYYIDVSVVIGKDYATLRPSH